MHIDLPSLPFFFFLFFFILIYGPANQNQFSLGQYTYTIVSTREFRVWKRYENWEAYSTVCYRHKWHYYLYPYIQRTSYWNGMECGVFFSLSPNSVVSALVHIYLHIHTWSADRYESVTLSLFTVFSIRIVQYHDLYKYLAILCPEK